jgi:type I restriction enzyme S subunit
MNQPWPVMPLENLLIRSEQTIGVDPEMAYKQVTVRLWGKGVGLRDKVLGSEISGSKRYQVKAGHSFSPK